MSREVTEFIRSLYKTNDFIPLHAPVFGRSEREYVLETIESTFVSSVGKFVGEFEDKVREFTGATGTVATVNGTAALHTCLFMAGVTRGDLIITQALTFVATCNAIHHMGAEPIFLDVSKETMGLCPIALESFLDSETHLDGELCIHTKTNKVVRAVVPMHTFGHPVHLDEIKQIANRYQITLVEDAAESLGSYYKKRHTGTFGEFGAMSFNGNKIITTGGGGMVLCASEKNAQRVKHITTTAKVPHSYEFYHDEAGFNYRLPNLNAALGCGQMEALPDFLNSKRKVAGRYREFFENSDFIFVDEPKNCSSNFWLNAVLCEDEKSRNLFLEEQNQEGIMCRPIWKLMHKLPMFKSCIKGTLTESEYIEARLVNLPSSPI